MQLTINKDKQSADTSGYPTLHFQGYNQLIHTYGGFSLVYFQGYNQLIYHGKPLIGLCIFRIQSNETLRESLIGSFSEVHHHGSLSLVYFQGYNQLIHQGSLSLEETKSALSSLARKHNTSWNFSSFGA